MLKKKDNKVKEAKKHENQIKKSNQLRQRHK